MADFIYRSIVIGIGATALLDVWVFLMNRIFATPAANWRPVGRWFCHLSRGKAFHDDISKAPAFPFELAAGWIGHYVVGIVFAAALLTITPRGWAAHPTLAPAMIVGIVTIGAGWFLLQPAMGAGIAASKRSNANQIRAMSIFGHIVFGFGLYGSALLIR